MSTQSSLPIHAQAPSLESSIGSASSSSCQMRINRRVSLSNSQLTRAADVAFRHDRQDRGLEANRSKVPSNPLNGPSSTESYHINLKKRKCDIDSYGNTTAMINTDFLSGIFQDLAEVEATNSDSAQSSCPVPNPLLSRDLSTSHLVSCASEEPFARPSKKARTLSMSRAGSFASRSKSFSHSLLEAGQTATCDASNDQAAHAHSPQNHSTTNTFSTVPTTSISTAALCGSENSTTAAEIVDQVFGDAISNMNIPFPTLPATVSASSCSSNNLTQTSVPAAQVLETPQQPASSYLFNIGGGDSKDSYGWFVDMDEDRVHDRLEEVAAASESCKARAQLSTDDGKTLPGLTFSAQVAETKTEEIELDSEVMWAKAADTVDDVLGEVFF